MKRFAVLISGRGSNLEAMLLARARGGLFADPVLVISNKSDAPGLAVAQRHGIPTEIVLWSDRESAEQRCLELLHRQSADFIVLAGFMKVLTGGFIDAYCHRILNIHPALLPSFPGVHAQRQALKYGARVTGCTTHFVDAGIDTGPIILQKAVPVLPDDTEETLSARILACEHELVVESVNLFAADCLMIDGDRRVRIDGEKFKRFRAECPARERTVPT